MFDINSKREVPSPLSSTALRGTSCVWDKSRCVQQRVWGGGRRMAGRVQGRGYSIQGAPLALLAIQDMQTDNLLPKLQCCIPKVHGVLRYPQGTPLKSSDTLRVLSPTAVLRHPQYTPPSQAPSQAICS